LPGRWRLNVSANRANLVKRLARWVVCLDFAWSGAPLDLFMTVVSQSSR
jgi:hypothetical protein